MQLSATPQPDLHWPWKNRLDAPLRTPVRTPVRTPWLDRVKLAPAQLLAHRSFKTKWKLAAGLAEMYLRGDPLYRNLMATNLTLCWPELSVEQRVALARKNSQEAFFAQMDQMRCWQLPAPEFRAQVRLVNAPLLHHLLKRQPVVMVCPHFVAMEVAAQRLSIETPGVSLFRPGPKSAFQTFRHAARQRFNALNLVASGAPLTTLVRQIKSGLPLFVLPDVDYAHPSAVYSPFFGVPAASSRTTAWCASKLGAAVLPISVRRLHDQHYEVTVHEPLANMPKDVVQGTHRVNQAIEELVRQAPAHYCWTQPRFATRPDGERPFYSEAAMKFAHSRAG